MGYPKKVVITTEYEEYEGSDITSTTKCEDAQVAASISNPLFTAFGKFVQELR